MYNDKGRYWNWGLFDFFISFAPPQSSVVVVGLDVDDMTNTYRGITVYLACTYIWSPDAFGIFPLFQKAEIYNLTSMLNSI